MQIAKRKKKQSSGLNRVSRPVGRHLLPGAARPPKFSVRGKRGKDISPFRGLGLSSLKNRINPLSEIEVAVKQGQVWGKPDDLLKNTDLHTKLVSDLYPIIKKHPKFIDNANWKPSSNIREVLVWLINRINELIGSEYGWRIVSESYENKYTIVTFYQHEVNASVYYSIPLSFLPELKQQNSFLHDVILDMLALIKSGTCINAWYEENGEWALDWMMDDFNNQLEDGDLSTNEIKDWENTIKAYSKGIATQYEELLTYNTATLQSLEIAAGILNPKNPLESQFTLWIHNGISLIKEKENIGSFCFDPDDPLLTGDNPLMPERYVFYCWDFDDHFYKCYEDCLQSTFNEYGTLPFISWKLTKQDSQSFNIPEISSFPKRLTDFFAQGVELIEEFKKQKNGKVN